MEGLVESVREDAGKSGFDMLCFFNGLVKSGELRAYRTEKSLVKADRLEMERPFVLEDPATGSMYAFKIGSYGGMVYNDGDSQTIYDNCIVEKLSKGIARNLNIRTTEFPNGAAVPSEWVSAKLRVSHSNDFESGGSFDYVRSSNGSLTIEGESDGLFKKICEFVRGR